MNHGDDFFFVIFFLVFCISFLFVLFAISFVPSSSPSSSSSRSRTSRHFDDCVGIAACSLVRLIRIQFVLINKVENSNAIPPLSSPLTLIVPNLVARRLVLFVKARENSVVGLDHEVPHGCEGHKTVLRRTTVSMLVVLANRDTTKPLGQNNLDVSEELRDRVEHTAHSRAARELEGAHVGEAIVPIWSFKAQVIPHHDSRVDPREPRAQELLAMAQHRPPQRQELLASTCRLLGQSNKPVQRTSSTNVLRQTNKVRQEKPQRSHKIDERLTKSAYSDSRRSVGAASLCLLCTAKLSTRLANFACTSSACSPLSPTSSARCWSSRNALSSPRS